MTKKTTKRALFSSVMALILCFSMLVGSTFAWFTDEVTSGTNQIVAGTLDVELYNGLNVDAPKVDTKTELFDEITYWEPGMVAYENLTVANLGNLALKYQLSVNFTDATANANGDTLAKVLKVGFVKDGIPADASREAALGLVTEWLPLASFVQSGELAAVEEEKIDSNVYGIVIYWQPSDIDNEFNMNKGENAMSINLGVKLFATQLAAEEDSFDQYYDGATKWLGGVDTAWYNETDTEFVIGTAEQLAGLAQLVNEGKDSFAGKTIKLASNLDLNNLAWTPISSAEVDDSIFVGFQGTFDGQGYTIANLNVEDDTWGLGLFGYFASKNVVVKNVNVHNASIKANDCAGVIVGYATYGSFSNINVTGNITVSGSSADGHVGGIAGCGYYASFENCSVIANGEIVSGGSFVGGIVGYQCANTKSITNCTVKNIAITGDSSVGGIAGIIATGTTFSHNTVENVVLTKTRMASFPKVGALIGCYDGNKDTTLADCSVKNVTLNGTYEEYPAYNVLYGAGYKATTAANFDVATTAVEGITNNLVEVTEVADNDELKKALDAGEDKIVLGAGEFALPTLAGKDGITIIGAADGSTVIGGQNVSTGFGSNFGKNTTIKNVTFAGSTNGVRYSYAQGGTTTFENCTFAGGSTYGFHIDSSNGATFIFNNCTFSGFNAFAGDLEKVIFNNCTFLNNGNYGHTNIWSVAEFNNCTFENATFGPRGDAKIYIDGAPVVYNAEALASVLTADVEEINVILGQDIDMNRTLLINGGSGDERQMGGASTKAIDIDLNGHKLNVVTTYWSVLGVVNPDAVVTIKNGSMASSQATGTWNSYDLSFASGEFVFENVVFEKAIALETNATLKNVTINETHDYYALWITAEGQNVVIDGLIVNSDGRGIKIDEQYVETPAKVTLSVSNAKFVTAKKAAIMVKSVAGAEITVNNVDIAGVAADQANVVWVDSDSVAHADKVTVNGAPAVVEP